MPEVIAKAFMDVPAGIEPSDSMSEKWADALKNVSSTLYARILEAVPDWKTFQEKMADISNQEWKGMIDPTFRSKSERGSGDIINMHLDKFREAYENWSAKVAYAFETVDGVEAKRFKEKIDNAKDLWIKGVIRSTLRFTGDKVRGRGVAPWAGYFLTDDKRAIGMMPPGSQVLQGGPVNVADTGLRTALKAGLTQKLVQAGVMISASKYDAAVVLEQNTIINRLIKGNQNSAYVDFQPTVDPAKSYCLYIVDGTNMRLEIQVVTV
ncbi:MAG: hypothetical protein V1871_02540 [Planctomycetota bacterium]